MNLTSHLEIFLTNVPVHKNGSNLLIPQVFKSIVGTIDLSCVTRVHDARA